MRRQDYGTTTKLWLSARDTSDWASKPGAAWPCSTLAGHRVFAEFDDGDLIELAIDGREDGDANDIDGYEFTAMTDDFLAQERENRQ